MDARVKGAIRDGIVRAVHAVTGPVRRAPRIDPPAGRADRTLKHTRLRRFAAGGRRAVVMPVASIMLAASPQAGASPCEDYKAVLAARIDATGVRGYTLEVVAADAPVPPGAKVIATCEAGARKFLYRRWGAVGASSAGAASAARAASAAQAAAPAEAPSRRATRGAREEPASTAVPASAPVRMRMPDANAAKPVLVAPVAAAVVPAAASASVVAAARPIAPAVVVPPPAVRADAAATAEVTPKPKASGFAAGQWQWIGAIALAALVAGLWLWRARFSAYDRDGLPRGPRL